MRREPVTLDDPTRMVRPVRRRPWAIGALLVFAVVLVAVFGTAAAPHIVKPGDLSTPHAQILEGTLTNERCTACHANVSASAWSQLAAVGHSKTDQSVTMTDRCMSCHHNRIPQSLARSAHNLSRDDRARLTQRLHRLTVAIDAVTTVSDSSMSDWIAEALVPDAAISQDDVACSVCHREHHGRMANISTVTDARCQTCHKRQFGSFASSHPEFENYPAFSSRTVAFDHVRHANLHYPKKSDAGNFPEAKLEDVILKAFDCRSCHVVSETNTTDPIVSTLPFEVACASCHDEELKVQTSVGPALLALPTLPREVAEQIDGWPENATGAADGELSAWMHLLLTAQDPELNLDGMNNLGFVDWDSPQRVTQAVRLGQAIRRFAIDLATKGQPRLQELVLAAGADKETAQAMARSFTPQLMRDAVHDWFGSESLASSFQRSGATPLATEHSNGTKLQTFRQVAFNDDLLIDWANEPDPLLAEESTPPPADDWQSELSKRFDAAKTQTLGGWYRDDLTLSLRYRGGGHHDVVLKALIEMSRSKGMELTESASVKACMECHVGPSWRTSSAPNLRDRLTKFTHRPHLDIRGLQDCQHCHELNHPASLNQSINLVDSRSSPIVAGDFVPLEKTACVKCHTSSAAGDHCTTCHRYHVGNVPTNASGP